jgi:hypothetical protein
MGLARHTREKHNVLTRISSKTQKAITDSSESQKTVAESSTNKKSIDFPVRHDFDNFTMINCETTRYQDLDSQLPPPSLVHSRPSSPCTPDIQAKRARIVVVLESEPEAPEPEAPELEAPEPKAPEPEVPEPEAPESEAPEPDDDELDTLGDEYSTVNEISSSSAIDSEQNASDYIVYEPTGGQVFDSEQARTRHNEFMAELQWVPESDANNPLHPWKHEGEIWLTDLLFRKGNISRTTADNLLGAFVNGKISMKDGPIQFKNSREMMGLLDVAARQGTVCLNYSYV